MNLDYLPFVGGNFLLPFALQSQTAQHPKYVLPYKEVPAAVEAEHGGLF